MQHWTQRTTQAEKDETDDIMKDIRYAPGGRLDRGEHGWAPPSRIEADTPKPFIKEEGFFWPITAGVILWVLGELIIYAIL